MALAQTQIDDLLALSLTARPHVAAYWKVIWDENDANQTKYYGEAAFSEYGNFGGIGVAIEPRIIGSVIADLAFEINPDLRTEEIPIVFDDIDKEITGKFQTFGSGVNVELVYYYPDVNGSQSVWFGQLQAPQVYGWKQLNTVATNGYRSRELLLPGSNHPIDHCRFTFGGELPTAEAVASNGCPYDRHVGGSTGNLNGAVPYTSCPRDKTACVARLGGTLSHPLYYGGFESNIAPIITDPGTGFLAKTKGNESNLKEPVRVVFGTKTVRALPILLWRRDPNTDNPDTGWFDLQWEVCEGPILGIHNFKVNEKVIQASLVKTRLGERGQAQTGWSADVPHYSSTAVVWTRYGQLNPMNSGPNDYSAECLVVGHKAVAAFNLPTGTATPGLLRRVYSDIAWTTEVSQNIAFNIAQPTTIQAPTAALSPFQRFSLRFEGTITFEHTETYTMTVEHTGGAKLTINGSVIVNQLGTSGTHTGAFAATAGTPYSFVFDFVRAAGGIIAAPWGFFLKWNSTSQAIEVVPNSAFSIAGVTVGNDFNRAFSADRVSCLLECMTNQKWGMRYPLDRFTAASWNHTQATLAQFVTYTHTFPDGETRAFTGRRSTFNAVLEGRPCDEQITDICRSGGICVPFQHEGKFYLRPFRIASTDELTNARVFTDRGESRNIVWDGGQPAIELSQVPNDKIVNEIELRYEDATNFDIERPITLDDKDQQLLAGRALGDENLQRVPMKFVAVGVRHLQEAIRLGYRLMKFGEFDEGGIENNLRLKFQTPFEQTLGLIRYDLIKIDSALLSGFVIGTNNGVIDNTETPEYFRILQMQKLQNGRVQITAQAYNHTAYTSFEVPLTAPSVPGEPPGTPLPSPDPDDPPPTPPPSDPVPGPEPPTDGEPPIIVVMEPMPDEPPTALTSYDSALGYIEVEVSA